MLYVHKTESRTFETTQATFDRMVKEGAIVVDQWLEAPERPAYDPSIQNAPVWVKGAWLVQALTPEELLARSDQAAVSSEQEQERAKIRDLVADLKAGNGTVAQRASRLERACVFLLRNALILLLTASFAVAGITVVTTVDAPLPTDPPVVGYIMYRRTGTLTAPIWTKVKTFPTNDRRFDITELGPGNYAVAAYNTGGESDKSNEVVIPGVPGKPLGLKVTIEFTP
jgi:hypothetical protein